MITAAAADTRCSIARTLAVIGQRWTMLVIREAVRGRTRFAEFRDQLGIAPDMLTDRLNTLVEHGILERRGYRDPGQREREEYLLTAAGRDLLPVLAALAAWGDEHRPTGYGPAAVYTASGRPVEVAFVDTDGRRLAPSEVSMERGPGARTGG